MPSVCLLCRSLALSRAAAAAPASEIEPDETKVIEPDETEEIDAEETTDTNPAAYTRAARSALPAYTLYFILLLYTL